MSSPLAALDKRWTRVHGTLYEGDVFSILSHSPFCFRAFESAIADGGIDCTRSFEPAQQVTFAERFWSIVTQAEAGRHDELLLFDVKNSTAEHVGYQVYHTTNLQRSRVAFYIGIVAADPTFVEVIPNYMQEKELPLPDATAESEHHVEVGAGRASYLPPSAYCGLDQFRTPYRMPISYLGKAMHSMRELVRGGSTYTNPWTRVPFDWKPYTTTATSGLEPAVNTALHTSYRAIRAIYEAFATSAIPIAIDFVGVQPRLGDFALILESKRMIVQHKVDDVLRVSRALDRVTIARNNPPARQHYFSALDRFDFLWFHFTFTHGSTEESECIFIPELELPDEFYTTQAKSVTFERAEFKQYRMVMDPGGQWVHRIASIVARAPTPCRRLDRPLRPKINLLEVDVEQVVPPERPAPLPRSVHGRTEHHDVNELSLRRFFSGIMDLCAARRSGLLIVLARNHPFGAFAYLRYQWTPTEQDRFQAAGQPPRAGHHLPPDVELLSIFYYTQYTECAFLGPVVRPSQHCQLDAHPEAGLTMWDLGGFDGAAQPLTPAVIPSDDFAVTDSQRQCFAEEMDDHSKRARTPSLWTMLNTGLYPAEYRVGASGAETYSGSEWASTLELLDRFLGLDPFPHPVGRMRKPEQYRHSLETFNRALAKDLLRVDSGATASAEALVDAT